MRLAEGPTRWWYAAAGVLAGGAGVAASVATAWALRASTDPVLAVASVVRDATPGALAEWLIGQVGHADKPLLITGTVLILLGLCGWAGMLTRRHALLADLVFLVLGALGLAAVWTQPRADVSAVLGVILGFLVWVVVLRFFTGLLTAGGTVPAGDLGEPADTGALAEIGAARRRFLAAGAGVAVVSALAVLGGRVAGRGRRAVEQARRLLRLPINPGDVPEGAVLDVEGVEPWRTPTRDFYLIHTAIVPPEIPPAKWRLRVHGMVDRELLLSYEDLVVRKPLERWITLCCVSNEVGGDLIGNAWWSGVPVRDVLAEAGVRDGADAVLQTSQDGWTCGTPLSMLTDPDRDALLALGMNGQPLTVDHGFPVRMVVPGLYGYVSATKWLVDLEVTRFDRFEAYWTERGWSPRGPVKTQSRIDVPDPGATVTAGTVIAGGAAWAQHTGIERVEVQLDGGPWTAARIGAAANADTWVQWSRVLEVEPGPHELRVRAVDRSGYTQTGAVSEVLPDGATGWHTVSFDAE